MEKEFFIIPLIAVFIIAIAVFARRKFKMQQEIRKNNPGYPKGYWLEQGAGVGVAIGAGIGVALGNIAIGVAVGVAIGTAIGSMWETQHKDEMRPMLEEEKKLRKQTILFMIGLLLTALIVFFGVTYFIIK